MSTDRRTLVMVYNADSGLLNAVRDSFWKTFAPGSYPCALCVLAFGFFTMHREWKEFLARGPFEQSELHRDDYRERLPDFAGKLPVILLSEDGADARGVFAGPYRIVVSADEMNAMDDLDQLIGLAERRLAGTGRARA